MRPEPAPAATLCLLAAALLSPALAQDDDRALQAFARPAAAAPRGEPVHPLQWERSLRAPDRYGPPRLREGDAALLAAARAERWVEVMQLLKSGQAAANAQDPAGGHTLVLAARAGQDELVRELVRRGADLERVGDDGFTALGAAAFAGRRSTVRLLLRAGAQTDRWGVTGQTALHLASLAGQVPVIDELLSFKAHIDSLNRQRETPLDIAAAAGQQDALDRLINGGADLLRAGRR